MFAIKNTAVLYNTSKEEWESINERKDIIIKRLRYYQKTKT